MGVSVKLLDSWLTKQKQWRPGSHSLPTQFTTHAIHNPRTFHYHLESLGTRLAWAQPHIGIHVPLDDSLQVHKSVTCSL